MGAKSTAKGKSFERKIASLLRERYPQATVHRSSQADRAYAPDVVVEGGPQWLDSVWLELQDARKPTPLAKLEQAERDIAASTNPERDAIIVWHKTGERTVWATMRVSVLLRLLQCGYSYGPVETTTATVEFSALLACVDHERRALDRELTA